MSDQDHIDSLLRDLAEARADEQDAASRAAALEEDLRDLGVDDDTIRDA